jgi:predicted 3-demethylubiquinone-9 3-methyltransferase (glyoxalase superfamily)
MQKIVPFLWFNNQAEEAANLYVSIFKNSRIKNIARYGAAGPGPSGSVMSVTFELDGREYHALNGGPIYKLTPAFSLFVNCETQAEIDELWEKLAAGGEIQQCGWLRDKFGLSWQIIPTKLLPMLQDKDPQRSSRVMEAMLQMCKLDLTALERAYDGN